MNLKIFSIEKHSNECFKMEIIGVYLVIVFILSVTSNAFLLWIYFVTKALRKPTDIYIIALAINNIVGCVVFLPFLIISNFNCG
jgi:hypothetical protein